MEGVFGISNQGATGQFVDIKNYRSTSNSADLNIWADHWTRGTNLEKGSETIVIEHNTAHHHSPGLIEGRKEIELTTIETEVNGSGAIPGTIYYIKDYNNGDRRNAYSQTYTTDRLYTGTTDVSGSTGVIDVLTFVVAKGTHGVVRQDDTGLNKKDRRSKYDDTRDAFDIHLWSYNHLYRVTEQELKGVGVLTPQIALDQDPAITETTKSTVDAYTEIDNLDKFYDQAKSWKVNSANLEYPSIDTQLIDGNGQELDLGSRNLVIDATAASAFSVNQNTHTITIKAGAFALGSKFSSIKTTGTITVQNGAALETGYMDSTGTHVFMELTNLDQQDILVTDQQNPSSPVTILNLTNQSNTYKAHFQLPAGGEINVLVRRDGYAPWTETIPDGELNFVREVNTSLSAITGANQISTINLLIKLLQKSEAVYNSVNVQGLPVPTVNVTTNTTSSTGPPSVDNQNVEIGILTRILTIMTAIRETINGN